MSRMMLFAMLAALLSGCGAISAIGDCAAHPNPWGLGVIRLESVQNATDQAKHVALAIAGRPRDYAEVAWFWSDQGDMKLQTAGISLGADTVIVSGEPDSNSFSVYHFGGSTLLAVDSVNRPADHMIARRLLAAGVSPDAADIAQGPQRLKQLSGART